MHKQRDTKQTKPRGATAQTTTASTSTAKKAQASPAPQQNHTAKPQGGKQSVAQVASKPVAPAQPLIPSAQLVELEKQTQRELRQVSNEVDAIYKELDGLLSAADREELAQQLTSVNKIIEDTREKLDMIQLQLEEKGNKSAKASSQISQCLERLGTINLERNVLAEKQNNVQAEVMLAREAVKDLRTRITSLHSKLTFEKLEDIDKEIARVSAQLNKTSLGASTLQDLNIEKGKLEKARSIFVDFLEASEQYKVKDQALRELEGKLKSTTNDLNDCKKRQKLLRDQLTELKSSDSEIYINNLKKQRKMLRDKLEAASEQRRNLRDNFSSKNDGTQAKQQELRVRAEDLRQTKKELSAKLEQLSAQLVKLTVDIDFELIPVLVGKGGSTINEIRTQTGADINIKREAGTVVIKGNRVDAENAKNKVQAILQGHKLVSATIKFDPLMVDPIFANKRAVVAEWRQLGARISVDATDKVITVRGESDAVAATKAVIEKFLQENARQRVTMKFPADMLNLIFGKGGETINAIRERHGCRIDVDRLHSTLAFEGKKDAVQGARSDYDTLIKNARKNEVSLSLKEDQIGAVLGKSGAVLRGVEQSTQATVTLDRTVPCLKIRGEADAVAAARAAFEEIITESRKETRAVKLDSRDIALYLLRNRAAKLQDVRAAAGRANVNLDVDALRITITGSKKDLEAGLTVLSEVIEDGKRALELAAEEREKLPEFLMDITEGDIPVILGPRGSTLRQISKESGARINLDKEACIVAIKGTEEAIEAAKTQIEALLNEEALKKGEKRSFDEDKSTTDYDIYALIKGVTKAPRAPIKDDPTKSFTSTSAAPKSAPAPTPAPVAAAPAEEKGKGKGKGKK